MSLVLTRIDDRLYGESCFNMCQLEIQKRKNARVVSGINLPMLLEVCLFKNSKTGEK